MPLTDQHRERLAGIVQQMEANKETPEDIKLAVETYKQKYGTAETAPAAQGNPWPGITSGFLRNAVTSGINMVGNVASAVMNPDATLAALGNTVEGLANEYVPGYVKAKEALPGYDPSLTQQQNATADALKQNMYDRYGSFQKVGHTLYTDPIGVLADASTVFDGAGAVLEGTSLAAKAAKASELARLSGKGAELAKTGAGITNPVNIGLAGAKVVVDKAAESAPRLYQSALKPSIALSPEEVDALSQTGFDNNIPVTKKGLTKLQGLIDNLNTSVKSMIDSDPRPQIDPNVVATRVDQIKPKFANQVNPESDVAALDASKQEFLRNQPNNMTASQAQELKQNTYKQLKNRSFGELKGAQIEAQKALARGLKEELEGVFPELKGMNAKEGSLIDLQEPLEKAVKRINNRELLGLPGTIVAEGAAGGGAASSIVGLLKMVMDQPALKSRLAIALNRAAKSKGIAMTPGSVSSRISSYANALSEAQARTQPPNEQ